LRQIANLSHNKHQYQQDELPTCPLQETNLMWRTGFILAVIIAAAVMAYQIGSRLSDQAIMTIAGVSCGIAASIPISVGLLIALTRERPVYAAEEYIEPEPVPEPYTIYRPSVPSQPQHQVPQQPQIIVVAPPQPQLSQNYAPYGNYLQSPTPAALPAPMQERTFRIVGDQDGD
jgi:hypothetical protein